MVVIGKGFSRFGAVLVGLAVGMLGNFVGEQLYTVVAGILKKGIHGVDRNKNGVRWSG